MRTEGKNPHDVMMTREVMRFTMHANFHIAEPDKAGLHQQSL